MWGRVEVVLPPYLKCHIKLSVQIQMCLGDAAAAGADNGNYLYDPDGGSEREEHGLGQ